MLLLAFCLEDGIKLDCMKTWEDDGVSYVIARDREDASSISCLVRYHTINETPILVCELDSTLPIIQGRQPRLNSGGEGCKGNQD